MKPNQLKERLREGRIPIGHMVFEFGTRGLPRLLETTGIDFVVIDAEHSGFDVGDIGDLMAWFKATSVSPFVRIPQIDYHFIARTLDLGAMGVMVPNVQSAEEANQAVAAAKYPPLGRRGVGLGTSLTDYKNVSPREFLNESNEKTAIICQVESRTGLDNLEEIAAVPGVDVLWVGHFDLSVSMGIAGEFQNEKFLAALRRVVEVAQHHKLGAGIQPRGTEQARQWIEMGFNVISCSGDVFVYGDAMKEQVAGIRQLTGDKP